MTLKSNAKFEEKLAVVWKITRRIWQNFIRTFKSVKIGTYMGSFCPK